LCKEFKVDVILGKSVSEIAIDKFNPDKGGDNKVSGGIQIAAKNLLKTHFKGFPLEIIDNLFKVIAERNPQVFFNFLEEMKLPIVPF